MKTLGWLSRKVIIYSFYALFFLTPLAMTPWNFELFEFNKMMLVYLLTVIIAASWAIASLVEQKLIIRRTPFDLPLALFALSQLLSTIFSINKRTSLIGYYSRFHGGLLSTISYLILFYAFVTFMGEKTTNQAALIRKQKYSRKRKSRLQKGQYARYKIQDTNFSPVHTCLNLLLTSVALVSAYGIAEHFGIDAHLWVQDVQNRVFSTIGQPNWLAALLITVIPLTFALAISRTKTIAYYLLLITYYLALLYTKSRSGILGFATMYTLFWGLVILKQKLKSFPWKIFGLITFLLLLISAIDGLRWIPKINSLYLRFQTTTNKPQLTSKDVASASASTINNQPTKPQIGTQLATGGTESGDIRRIVWQGAIDVWRHYPIFGSGVETFAYSYYNFRPQAHNLVSEWDFLYNKAHNEYLNFLATTGVVGLGTYLLLQAWAFIWLFKQVFAKKSLKKNENWPLTISLIAALAGLSASNFFGFSTVAVALLFFLYPAIAIILTQQDQATIYNPASKNLSSSQRLSIVFLLLITLYLLFAIAKWWYADTVFALGKKYSDAGYPQEAFPRLQQAVKLMPGEPTFRSELAEAAADLAIAEVQNQATASAIQHAQLALDQVETVKQQNSVHLNFVKSRARVILTLAAIDPNLFRQGEQTLLEGLELSPTDAKLMYNLGLVYLQMGDEDQALKTLQKAIELKPNYEAARFVLGTVYEERGQTDQARQQYQYILNHISPNNQKVLQKLEAL